MNSDSKIRAIIIEDEDHNREHLITLLKQHCPLINVVGHATGVNTGYDLIAMHKPDLLFLDIQLIDGTGFDLLEKCEKLDFKVIFATAYESYAIRAFRFSALDYLLKPLDPIELKSAVEKAEASPNTKQVAVEEPEPLTDENQVKA